MEAGPYLQSPFWNNLGVLLDCIAKSVGAASISSYVYLDGQYRFADGDASVLEMNTTSDFRAMEFLHDATWTTRGLTCRPDVQSLVMLPLFIEKEHVAVLALSNVGEQFKGLFGETTPDRPSTSDNLNLLLRLCILALHKRLILEKYKDVYNDSTYFSKDLFLANISHEIRTPLNGLLCYIYLLLQTPLNKQQKDYAERMNSCGTQLMRIVNDVIVFSQLSSGGASLEPEVVNLDEIVETLRTTVANRFATKRQTLSFESVKNCTILIDKQKLLQILVNLATNSSKFTEPGGKVGIRFRCDYKTQFLTVDVKDTGIGISEEDQMKLFNSFVQIKNCVTKGCGSGLGLAIVKRLSELMNGDIVVRSQLGRGSTFTCRVPFKVAHEFDVRQSPNFGLIRDRRVLVIEPDADKRLAVMDILINWGMLPTVSSSEKEALRYLGVADIQRDQTRTTVFDLVLIDIEGSGLNLAKAIQDVIPLMPRIALVDQHSDGREQDLSLFQGKVRKPVEESALFACVIKALNSDLTRSAFLADIVPLPRGAPKTPSSKSTVRVLIAEDVEDNRRVLQDILIGFGFKTIVAVADGHQAASALTAAHEGSEPFEILFLDLRMPVADGYYVIEFMKKKQWTLPTIVAVSACVLESDRNKCIRLGVQYFLSKPIQVNQLRDVTSQIINKNLC
jgi:signal transduction histidine kinase/DNA-binding response OmpR family regulator